MAVLSVCPTASVGWFTLAWRLRVTACWKPAMVLAVWLSVLTLFDVGAVPIACPPNVRFGDEKYGIRVQLNPEAAHWSCRPRSCGRAPPGPRSHGCTETASRLTPPRTGRDERPCCARARGQTNGCR